MIVLEEITKHYGSICAVDKVSFTVKPGEVFGLLGPNGAGKSTTIRILTTLTRPDGGRAWIGNFDVVKEKREIKKLIGVVPQENNLDKELTAYENLKIYALLHKVPEREKRIFSCLEMVGLRERMDSIVSEFSGGMQRRLLMARAMLADPAVLFLDEPSIGLDPQIRRQLWDVVRGAAINGRTVVITTHYIEEAEALCHRVGILNKGRLIALDTPQQLKNEVGNFVVEHIDRDGRLIQHFCPSREEAKQCAYGQTADVTVREANLEDVFVKLTGERIE